MGARVFHHNRFDAASLPSGWTFGAGYAVTATNPIRGARSLGQTTIASAVTAQWNTVDTNSGNVRVRADFQIVSGSSTNTLLEVHARGTGLGTYSSATAYIARIHASNALGGVALIRRNSGTPTFMAEGGDGTTLFATGVTYRITLTVNGTSLAMQIQRLSDGQFVNAARTGWQTSAVDCATATDSSITGAGQAGIMMFQGASGTCVFRADEFVFESLEAPATIAVDNANLFHSPYNWWINGSVAERSVNPGSYHKTNFSGTSAILTMNAETFTGSNAQEIAWRINGGAWEVYNRNPYETRLTLASGLADTTHTLELIYKGHDPTQTIWATTPTMGLVITGYELDNAKALSAPTLKTGRTIWYGDSVSYGIATDGTTSTNAASHDAREAPFYDLIESLNSEIGVIGFGSQGYGKVGLASVPDADDAWDLYYSGRSRLSGGLLTPTPTRVVLYWGTADYTGRDSDGTNPTDSAIRTGVQTTLTEIRVAAPNVPIHVIIPATLGRNATLHNALEAAIINGFEDAAGARVSLGTDGEVQVWRGGTDTGAYLIFLGESISTGIWDYTDTSPPTAQSLDGIHPNAATNAAIALLIADGITLAENPPAAAAPAGGGGVHVFTGSFRVVMRRGR